MNYNETLKYIQSLGMFSHPATLDRIKKVLCKLDNPQNSFKSVHIAGTNGKGSVAVMTASVFKSAGFKTGLFVSPYIINFRERIQLNGEFISETDLCRLSEDVINTKIELTEFEFITAVCFLYFRERKIDIAVIETGLGGRLDATNALSNVAVSVITKIGLDHTKILGDTIEKIAAEKCGIIKSDNVVTTVGQDKKALDVIKSFSKNLTVPNIGSLKIIRSDLNGNAFSYKDTQFSTRLAGEFQVINAITAIETVNASGINVSLEAVMDGIASAFIPARLEIVSKSGPVVLDGAHNPDAASVLAEFMKNYNGTATAVVGAMRDKNYSDVLKCTLPFCHNVITVKAADLPRALDAETLAREAKKYCKNVLIADSYDDALKKAADAAKGGAIFVFGSLYLASGVRNLLLPSDK